METTACEFAGITVAWMFESGPRMTNATTKPVPVLSPRLALAAWLLVACAIALSGAATRAPFVFPLWLVTSVVSWTVAYRRSVAVRQWVQAIDLRALLLGHAIRLPIGALFLHEMHAGRLAPVFATRAGYGDIAIGALALPIVLAVPTLTPLRRRLVAGFSLVGLVDILVAVGTGMYLLLVARDPLFVAPISHMPYPFIPALVVPAVILSHLAVLARLRTV